MSIPPQLIRVKRKRDDESPVTFLQFDEGAKRHRTGSNWVYQRRHADPQSPTEAPTRSFHDVKPVIHVSGPDGDAPRTKAKVAVKASNPTSIASTLNPVPADESKLAEPRRFHISKKMMMTATGSQSAIPGMKKKGRYGPAVFVERGRVKASQRASRALEAMRASATPSPDPQQQQDGTVAVDQKATEPRLKKPGVRSRTRSPMPDPNARAPLPASAMNPHNQDMSRITADMNDWVMKEIGANLQQMENEKRKAVQHRFKPKTPTKSYAERHPEVVAKAPEPNQMDTTMSDASDMDDDDWVIEEYVRVPAHAMMVNIAPADVGVLVLDGEEDNTLFFGPENDEDEELDEDDEDENAENYYTADYPEDEVESDDEYGRRPYGYRNGNASDDEEFDNMDYDDDDDGMVLEGDGDDDATMARIKNYVRRSHAFQ